MRMKITCENVDNPWANAEGWAAKLLAEQPQTKPNLKDNDAFLSAFNQMKGS